MHINVRRFSAAVAGGAVLSLVAATAACAPGPATSTPQAAAPAAQPLRAPAAAGTQLWVSRYTGSGYRSDNAPGTAPIRPDPWRSARTGAPCS